METPTTTNPISKNEATEDFEEKYTEVDDLITDAQDALFDGKMDLMMELCKKIIKIKPKESSAYELLIVGHISQNPPDYAEATTCAIEWGKACGSSAKQLSSWLKTTYYSNDIQRCGEAGKQIMNQKGMTLEKALAASLLADEHQLKLSSQIAAKASEQFDIDDLLEGAFAHCLLAWVDICSDNREKGVNTLTKIATETPVKDESDSRFQEVRSFCTGLLILENAERDHFKTADYWLEQAKKWGLSDYPNITAAQALYYYYTLATPSPEQAHNVSGKIEEKVKDLARKSVSQCHHLFKKRLESKIHKLIFTVEL